MSFTGEAIAYIKSQPLARVATVAPDGQPDVAAVGFEFDDTHFYIGGPQKLLLLLLLLAVASQK